MRESREAIAVRSVPDTNAPRPRDIDPRTGLPWVRAAEGSLESWFSTNRWSRKCSVVKFGVDGFDRFARSHSDEEVDLALFIVGLVLKSHAHRNSLVGRCQSGEFIVLLPSVGVRRAVSFSKQVTLDVASQFGHNGSAITVSSGVASQDGSVTHPHQLLEMADSALRAAKWQGGNRVAVGSIGGQSRWLPQRSWLEAVRFVRSA